MWNALVFYPDLNDDGLNRFRENYDPLAPTQLRLMKKEYRNALKEVKALDLDFRFRMEVLNLLQVENDVRMHPVTIRKYSMV